MRRLQSERERVHSSRAFKRLGGLNTKLNDRIALLESALDSACSSLGDISCWNPDKTHVPGCAWVIGCDKCWRQFLLGEIHEEGDND